MPRVRSDASAIVRLPGMSGDGPCRATGHAHGRSGPRQPPLTRPPKSAAHCTVDDPVRRVGLRTWGLRAVEQPLPRRVRAATVTPSDPRPVRFQRCCSCDARHDRPIRTDSGPFRGAAARAARRAQFGSTAFAPDGMRRAATPSVPRHLAGVDPTVTPRIHARRATAVNGSHLRFRRPRGMSVDCATGIARVTVDRMCAPGCERPKRTLGYASPRSRASPATNAPSMLTSTSDSPGRPVGRGSARSTATGPLRPSRQKCRVSTKWHRSAVAGDRPSHP